MEGRYIGRHGWHRKDKRPITIDEPEIEFSTQVIKSMSKTFGPGEKWLPESTMSSFYRKV